MSNVLGIRGYDYVEFYVGSAKMTAYWYAKTLGMKIMGYTGPETGSKDRVSYYLESDRLKIVLTSAIDPGCYEVLSFLNQHGDGVKRWAV